MLAREGSVRTPTTTVVHLTTVHPRTDSRITGKEARALAGRLPHRVVLMVADGKGSVADPSDPLAVHDLGRLDGGRIARVLRGSARALRAIRILRPAVVHFHDPELIPLGVVLRAMGIKVIYDVHEDVPRQVFSKHYLPSAVRYLVAGGMALLEVVCARFWTAIVPATPLIAKTPVLAGRFPPHKTVVVHNFPIADEIVVPDAPPYASREQSVAYLGGIERVRGGVEMVRAFDSLHSLPEARLELAGWFSPTSLEDELRALPGWRAVNFHGEVDRRGVARILSRTRAGVVVLHPEPTHIESYPIKLFEYMAAGLPIIASDFPVWRNIIDDAGCGILVDPMDPAALAGAIRWVLTHPAEAEEMGRHGRAAAERKYSWKSEAARLLALYEQVLKE